MVLDEPKADDEVFEFGHVRVVVDRGTYFYLDDPIKIDYDEAERGFRLRSVSRVIPNVFRL